MAKFTVDSSGFDEFFDQLNDLSDKSKGLSDGITCSDLFTDEFMLSNTTFSSFEEFLRQGNFDPDDNFVDIPEFSDYVINNTKFPSWDDMLATATNSYLGY